jgi:predicted nucleic acid-binding protein
VAVRQENFALYLDTSALIKLFVDEDGSAQVRALASGRTAAKILLVSRLGYTEASVALARMVHLGRIPAADLSHHLGALEKYWEESIQDVDLSENVLRDARQVAQRYPLRTYDAIHLASAREAKRTLKDGFDGELRFLAFDASLMQAARNLGFASPR